MDFKERIYQSYRSDHTRHCGAAGSFADFVAQFPVWSDYYRGFLPEDRSASILDIACGDGGLVFWLTRLGYGNACGIDVSPEQVAQAKTLGVANVVQADLRAYLRDHPNQFRAIFAIDILEHFPLSEGFEILELIFSALTADGVVVIKSPNAGGIFGSRLRYADITHECAFTSSSIGQFLRAAGFSHIVTREAGPVGHGFFSWVRAGAWMVLRFFTNIVLIVETGRPESVLTQNIIAAARKSEKK